jgi:thiamine-phosphate pyrophosphorylase
MAAPPARSRASWARASTVPFAPRLYLITPAAGDPLPAVAAALSRIPQGTAAVQLRQPLPARALLRRALDLARICAEYGAQLFVNDRADIALAARAGVHLPTSGFDARELRALGLATAQSVHSPEEAARASADFAVFAPVFPTPGKVARGLDALAAACRASPVPVVALGGIDETNARSCIEAGATGVASIRAVLGSADPAAAALRLLSAL